MQNVAPTRRLNRRSRDALLAAALLFLLGRGAAGGGHRLAYRESGCAQQQRLPPVRSGAQDHAAAGRFAVHRLYAAGAAGGELAHRQCPGLGIGRAAGDTAGSAFRLHSQYQPARHRLCGRGSGQPARRLGAAHHPAARKILKRWRQLAAARSRWGVAGAALESHAGSGGQRAASQSAMRERGLVDMPIFAAVVFMREEPATQIRTQQPAVPVVHASAFVSALRESYFAARRLDARATQQAVDLLYH